MPTTSRRMYRRRGSDGDGHPIRSRLHEVGRDLGTGVPEAGDQHVLARVVRAGAVCARVDERAAKCLPAGPLRDDRRVVLPGGDDDDRSAERGSRRLDDPAVPVAADARHVRFEADVEPEPHRVVAQVAGELVLRDVARKLTR